MLVEDRANMNLPHLYLAPP